MKATTLQKRLAKFTGAKNSIAYQVCNDVVNNTNKSCKIFGKIVRPCHTSGTGRFCSNMDYTNAICYLLNDLKIKYVIGNDSPRGGLTGNFITIKTKIEY